jgi:hypothetical protein
VAWLTDPASRAAIGRVVDGLYLLDQRARLGLGRPKVVESKRNVRQGMTPLRGDRKFVERVSEGRKKR